jgi:hypothetical protein
VIARETQWYRVKQGGYVRDLNGRTWKVHEITRDTVVLVDRERRTRRIDRPAASKPVTILEPTLEDATKTLQELLEAVVIEEVPVA